MLFGVPRLKRTLSAFFVSVLVGGGLVSCSNYNSSSNRQGRSGLKFRAFVSNPLNVSSSGVIPELDIVDATKDVLSTAGVSLSGLLPDAGMMVLSPKKERTLVVSPLSDRVAVVDNATEATSSAFSLPGPTDSLFVWTDDVSAFVAMPRASILGQPAGVVDRVDISSGANTAAIPVPGAHYLVPSPTGNQILIFSDNSDSVTLLFPALLGTGGQTNTQVPCSAAPVAACTVIGFDKPVWGVFSADGSRAFIMNCGPERGGTAAGVAVLDMTQSPPVLASLTVPNPIPVAAATIALLQGTNLYVAGTPQASSQNGCSTATISTTICGRLTAVDTVALTASAPVEITNGYHHKMAMGANGKLFIGARTCTNVSGSSSCLTIADTGSANAVSPPGNGDVTGIEPIPNRRVVYVCEGGALRIYDTTTDQLQTTQVNIVGQAIDVKVVDF